MMLPGQRAARSAQWLATRRQLAVQGLMDEILLIESDDLRAAVLRRWADVETTTQELLTATQEATND